jgi:hypothetical protein
MSFAENARVITIPRSISGKNRETCTTFPPL